MNNEEKIINLYKRISNKIKIYIYPYTPGEKKKLKKFINKTVRLKSYEWGETYKSWIYFMKYLRDSPIYTSEPSNADLFLVPQWENLNKGQSYKEDLIVPLIKAINSSIYKKTPSIRNHIFIYISDDTVWSEDRLPDWIKSHLKERFIIISYSGRINSFGQNHNKKKTCFYDSENEIIVPPPVPIQYRKYKNPSRFAKNTFVYSGTLTPDPAQIERYNFLNYMKSNSMIESNHNAYFGIHCAGWGIWSARLYNYIQMGIIPIIPSDGVILPFEKFLDYRSFTIKILSSTYNKNDTKPILFLEKVAKYARKYSFSNDDNLPEIVKKLYNMQENIKKVSIWLDWRSKVKFKNPFTLIIIILYEFVCNR